MRIQGERIRTLGDFSARTYHTHQLPHNIGANAFLRQLTTDWHALLCTSAIFTLKNWFMYFWHLQTRNIRVSLQKTSMHFCTRLPQNVTSAKHIDNRKAANFGAIHKGTINQSKYPKNIKDNTKQVKLTRACFIKVYQCIVLHCNAMICVHEKGVYKR